MRFIVSKRVMISASVVLLAWKSVRADDSSAAPAEAWIKYAAEQISALPPTARPEIRWCSLASYLKSPRQAALLAPYFEEIDRLTAGVPDFMMAEEMAPVFITACEGTGKLEGSGIRLARVYENTKAKDGRLVGSGDGFVSEAVGSWFDVGAVNEAEAFAGALKAPADQRTAWLNVMRAYAKAGDKRGALKALQALAATGKVPAGDDSDDIVASEFIALSGDDAMQKVADGAKIPGDRWALWWGAARMYKTLHDTDRARDALKKARDAAADFQAPESRATCIAWVARELLEQGFTADAAESARRAATAAEKVSAEAQVAVMVKLYAQCGCDDLVWKVVDALPENRRGLALARSMDWDIRLPVPERANELIKGCLSRLDQIEHDSPAVARAEQDEWRIIKLYCALAYFRLGKANEAMALLPALPLHGVLEDIPLENAARVLMDRGEIATAKALDTKLKGSVKRLSVLLAFHDIKGMEFPEARKAIDSMSDAEARLQITFCFLKSTMASATKPDAGIVPH